MSEDEHARAKKKAAEYIAFLKQQGYQVVDPPQPRELLYCAICSAKEDEVELIDVRIIVHEGEEGHANVVRYVCDGCSVDWFDKFVEMGFGVHAHTGVCFLEDERCPGYQDPALCSTPETQYGDDDL